MNVRLTQIDGKLPNLVLMRLADWHRRQAFSPFRWFTTDGGGI